jgi:hypothetical protein
MMQLIANSITRVCLTSSSWGYHVSRQGHVLVFIKSEGNDKAKADLAVARFEEISELYQRLLTSSPPPRERTINTLGWIVNKPSPDHYGIPMLNNNSINALLRRGLIRPIQPQPSPVRTADGIRANPLYTFEPVYQTRRGRPA